MPAVRTSETAAPRRGESCIRPGDPRQPDSGDHQDRPYANHRTGQGRSMRPRSCIENNVGIGCFAPTDTLATHTGTSRAPALPGIGARTDDRKDRPWGSRRNLERVTRFERATPCLGSTEWHPTLKRGPKTRFRLLALVPLLPRVHRQANHHGHIMPGTTADVILSISR